MTSRPLQFAHKPGGTRNLRGVALTALKRFSSDRCTTLAASIGFYSAFSLAPTLLIVLTVAGWFFGESAASGRLFAQVRDVMGKDAAMAMQTIVEHAHRASGGGLAALVSTGPLIVGRSGTFSSLDTGFAV